MHDPTTVAHEIKWPWKSGKSKLFPEGYRRAFVTIWHNDPELDGSDDSCGWSYVRRLTDEQKKVCREMAEWEARWPYFFVRPARAVNPAYPALLTIAPGDAAALTLAAWHQFAWRLYRERLAPKMVVRAVESAVMPQDNYQATFVLDDVRDGIVETMESRFHTLLRGYLTARRRWWQHPRWHVRHWSVQIHALQAFKRWAFTRCAQCGRRFAWGESGLGTWSGTGPLWFSSETLTHMRCAGISDAKADCMRGSPSTEEREP